jgi:alpha-L-fucosidase
MNPERASMLLPLLRLQPGIIYNNRLGGGFNGDTETPEQEIPATGYPGRDWETCMTVNDTWGYKSYDDNWKSTETLIRNLVDIASKGGNYLLNVGPTSEGLIPEPIVERLRGIAAWMKVNGEAIHGATASPFKSLPWGRCTTKITPRGATLFLHVFNWPADGQLLVPGLKNEATRCELLTAAGRKSLALRRAGQGWVITLPAEAPDPISSTVVLQIKGAPEIEVMQIAQENDGSISLPAGEARLHGTDIRQETKGGHENIGFWTNPDEWADWQFKVATPGKFDLSAELGGPDAASFDLTVGESRLRGTMNPTGSYDEFRSAKLGVIEISSAGVQTLAVHPVKENWRPINLRSLRLAPAAPQ